MPDEKTQKTNEYGIVMPDNVEEDTKAIGKVISVGPEVKGIKKGDRVIYGAYAGEQLEFTSGVEKEQYVLLDEEHVLAFIE